VQLLRPLHGRHLGTQQFGIAIAAMIKMMATTINNSINEKPFCCFFIFLQNFGFPKN